MNLHPKKVKRGAKAKAPPAPAAPTEFKVDDEGEVVEVSGDDWREDLTRKPTNPFCKGCKSKEGCIITRIAAVALCDKRIL